MDLCDDPASSYIVATLELPGLKQEDMSVRIENEELVVRGERRFRSLARSPSRSLATSPDLAQNAASGSGSSALVRARSAEPATADMAHPALPHGYTTQEIKYGMFERRVGLPAGTQVCRITDSFCLGTMTHVVAWIGRACTRVARGGHADALVAAQPARGPGLLAGGGGTHEVAWTGRDGWLTCADENCPPPAAGVASSLCPDSIQGEGYDSSSDVSTHASTPARPLPLTFNCLSALASY